MQKQPLLAVSEHSANLLSDGIMSTTTIEVSSFRPPWARMMAVTIFSGAACTLQRVRLRALVGPR